MSPFNSSVLKSAIRESGGANRLEMDYLSRLNAVLVQLLRRVCRRVFDDEVELVNVGVYFVGDL